MYDEFVQTKLSREILHSARINLVGGNLRIKPGDQSSMHLKVKAASIADLDTKSLAKLGDMWRILA